MTVQNSAMSWRTSVQMKEPMADIDTEAHSTFNVQHGMPLLTAQRVSSHSCFAYVTCHV